MMKDVMLIISGIFLSYCAGSWAVLFWIIGDGWRTIAVEPEVQVLLHEFMLAALLSLLGFVMFIYGLVQGIGRKGTPITGQRATGHLRSNPSGASGSVTGTRAR